MIKTAVILAARKERDSEIPYPLMSLADGSCLIQHTIKYLKELGLKKIFLVVGYKSKDFLKFQDETVHLVENLNYEFCSSMGSLACVSQAVDEDFILIEGDVFFEKDILVRLIENENANCSVIAPESGNGDEAFIELHNNRIKTISKDRRAILNIYGEMLGISKISYSTFEKMLKLWDKCNNPYVNYEYVFVQATRLQQRAYVEIKDLIWGDVDSQADFRKLINDIAPRLYRKKSIYDREYLLNLITGIFPERKIKEGEITIQPMGGMSNRNFKISFSSGEYVLRIPGEGTEGLVDRKYEENNSGLASSLGINTESIYFNAETGVKLTRFLKNAQTLNKATIQRADNLKEIAQLFKKLHTSSPRMQNHFNPLKEIEKYENLLAKTDAKMYEGWENTRKEISRIGDWLENHPSPQVPCHNDPVPENFIRTRKGRIYLIDWEYSGLNDPACDIAALFLESDFNETNQEYFLKCYYGTQYRDEIRVKIEIYQILLDYLWSIWTLIKESQGANFGDYGTDRFSRSKSKIKNLVNKWEPF